MTQRLLKRGETSGRADDNLESIGKRLKTFEESSMPVIKYYSGLDRIKKVNSEKHVSEVTIETLKCFRLPFDGETIAFVLGGPGSGKG